MYRQINLDRENFLDSLYPENLDDDFDITKDLESRINSLGRRGFIFIENFA